MNTECSFYCPPRGLSRDYYYLHKLVFMFSGVDLIVVGSKHSCMKLMLYLMRLLGLD